MSTVPLDAADLSAAPATVLLEQAEYLFTEGYPIASGMMARAALESCLRTLCQSHGCEVRRNSFKRSPKCAYLRALLKAGVIDKATANEAERLFSVGSRIAHCLKVDSPEAENLLQGVRAFIDDQASETPQTPLSGRPVSEGASDCPDTAAASQGRTEPLTSVSADGEGGAL